MTPSADTQAVEVDDAPDAPEVRPLLAPAEGVPEVVETPAALREAAAWLAGGTGPIAIDAERASGYRYGQRAYLVQLRRAGAGTVLLDPIAVPELDELQEAMRGVEWVLHAASQDLTCLLEIGLVPDSLFDTELAGRLLGFPRVGLAALVEQELGLHLAKEHSAVDWSTRPLPLPWLSYAALDVEVLVELRDLLDAQLVASGKREWAAQEFEAVRLAPPAPPRVDPWRRTSGLHKLRRPRQLATVRALWVARDEVARRRDVSPGRVLPDAAVIAAGLHPQATPAELAGLPAFSGRGAKRHLQTWQEALAGAQSLPDSELPSANHVPDGPPPPRSWSDRDPDAAARLAAVRAGVAAIGEQVGMPAENVLPPDALKRICWEPPTPIEAPDVQVALVRLGARPWQVTLTADAVTAGLLAVAPDPADAETAAIPDAASAAAAEPPASD